MRRPTAAKTTTVFPVPHALGYHVAVPDLMSLTSRAGNRTTKPNSGAGVETGQRIRRVVAEGRISSAYQPIYCLASREIIGYEALARFPDFPKLPVALWFEQADQLGLTVELELAAIRAALNAIELLATDAWLAINASPLTLGSPRLSALLARHDPTRMVLEITEHSPIVDYEDLARTIAPLRHSGARLAIDDVGAGFASLRHILALAPEIIKLDSTLTHGLTTEPTKRALIRALVSFAAEIGALIIAEGVETQSTAEQLDRLGVQHAQGYHLARPAPQTHPARIDLYATPPGLGSPRDHARSGAPSVPVAAVGP